jgi:hypothetical protein
MVHSVKARRGFAPVILLILIPLLILGIAAYLYLPNSKKQQTADVVDQSDTQVKIAFIETTKTNTKLQWADTAKLYTSNIDQTEKKLVADLSSLEKFGKVALIEIDGYIPETKEVVVAIQDKTEKLWKYNYFRISLETQGIKPMGPTTETKCADFTALNNDTGISIRHIFDDDTTLSMPPTKFIDIIICDRSTGEQETFGHPKNEINRESFTTDLGQKGVVFGNSEYAYIAEMWNGYNNQIDERIEQVDLKTGQVSPATSLQTIQSKAEQKIPLRYASYSSRANMFEDTNGYNHIIYLAGEGDSIKYYDLNLEKGTEKEIKLFPNTQAIAWTTTEDIIGPGLYSPASFYIDVSSPIKQNENDCAFYNISRGEVVGFPDTGTFCPMIILK